MNNTSQKYLFYSVLAVSITSTLIVAMLLVFNKIDNQADSNVVDTKNNKTSSVINQPQNDKNNSVDIDTKDSNNELIPTFAYTINKSTGDFEIICQVKVNYGCDLYAKNNDNKVLIKKYDQKISEDLDSESIKSVKWGFNISSWNYGSTIVLVTIDNKGANVGESIPIQMSNILISGSN